MSTLAFLSYWGQVPGLPPKVYAYAQGGGQGYESVCAYAGILDTGIYLAGALPENIIWSFRYRRFIFWGKLVSINSRYI